jgi:dTDP-4-dehydrorhamnose reductase|tara:strand:- start:1613 stop:2371 length:759 start_codon:yes stop_codon:yes gene_type:complete
MNILILGHKGYLGSYLKENLTADIVDNKNNYDYIINCIGKPNLEFCEVNPHISYESNFKVVSDAIDKHPYSKLIHFSSYYVYDDIGTCTEDDNTTSAYKYCEHKLASEEIVKNSRGLVFRVGKLFGHSKIDKQCKLTEELLLSKNIVLDDVRFNPTSLRQVLRAVQYELDNNNLEGVFNLSNDGTPSHYEYGKFIQKHYNRDIDIVRISKHKRKFHNYGSFLMSCEKIKNMFFLDRWEDDMLYYLGELKCIV